MSIQAAGHFSATAVETAPIPPSSEVELRRLAWDTAFFGSTMGTVVLTRSEHDAEPLRRAAAVEQALRIVLVRAMAEGYAHVICRVPGDDLPAMWAAERAELQLVDVGVDSTIVLSDTLLPEPPLPIRNVQPSDVPGLGDLAADAFRLSRFSADPFFSVEQVRDFHREWVRNLCAGLAQRVLVCEVDGAVAGFVACALNGDEGRIVLIATRSDCRGRGLGRGLLGAALRWFAVQEARVVHVKTQAHNYPALALYHRAGFTVSNTELTFSMTLKSAGPRSGRQI